MPIVILENSGPLVSGRNTPHTAHRITMWAGRPRARRAELTCLCGAQFYGMTRIDAQDAHTGHVAAANVAALFAGRTVTA